MTNTLLTRGTAVTLKLDEHLLEPSEMLNVLFLCTGNSCRSQMAEGWAKSLRANDINAYSAGTQPQGLNQMAVQVMREEGIDISSHQSKTLEDLQETKFDLIVTVCDQAKEHCPVFPGSHQNSKPKLFHQSFADPPALAKDAESDEEALAHYRRVRDEIRAMVERL